MVQDVKIIAISAESEKATKEFAKEHGSSVPIVFDEEQMISKKYRVKYSPQIVMIDAKGKVILFQQYGTGVNRVLSQAEQILQPIARR
ncbi:MAG: peroxiredoxin family protein [bacterium]